MRMLYDRALPCTVGHDRACFFIPAFHAEAHRKQSYEYSLPQQQCCVGKASGDAELESCHVLPRKMAAGHTYVLHCVRMEVIHSDCSFVDNFSQNHFNMKLHYGFLFFDYLFKFILQLTIHYLSPDLLGFWYVFVSIGGLTELLDSGFTPTLSHSMSTAWSGA